MTSRSVVFSRRLMGVANALSLVGAIVAAAVFVGMTLLIVLDVVLRNTVGSSTLIATEFSGYALATMTYLSLAFTFREGAHIRISFLQDRLPLRVRRPLEVLTVAFVAAGTAMAILFVWRMVVTSFQRGTIAYTVARTPLYVPQSMILIGLALLLVQLVAYGVSVAITGEVMDTKTDEAELKALLEEAP